MPDWRPGRKKRESDAGRSSAHASETGSAVTVGSGFSNSGVYIDRSIRHGTPRQPAPWPHVVGGPPARVATFVERPQASELRSALATQGVVWVLDGPSGAGKTQLAADYALTAFESGRLDVLVWITASSRQAVVDGYARAAAELLAIDIDDQAAQRFLGWLQPSASRPACRWLIVLDDVTAAADLGGLWPPTSSTGRTLVTARRRDPALTGPGYGRIEVRASTAIEADEALTLPRPLPRAAVVRPETLIARNNQAFYRGKAGDVVGAAADLTELLPDLVRVLGADHPDTLTARDNLARFRGESGDVAGAVAAFTAVLADRLRVLGPVHPDTLVSRNNLAYFRGKAGDVAGAASDLAALIPDLQRVRGPYHADVLTARDNLARFRGESGDAAGAVAAFTEVLADRTQALGPAHPDTLVSRNNLAYYRGIAGDAFGAVRDLLALLPEMMRVLGPEHPDTLTTMNNLARFRAETGGSAEPFGH